MFTVRTIRAEDGQYQDAKFDLEPELSQGRAICNMFAEFLAGRPGEFREQLPFVAKGNIELEWAAAGGGAAFAAFFAEGKPVTMGILLSGSDEEADTNMVEALRVSVVDPMLGDKAGSSLELPDLPAMINVQMNDQPELIPAVQLLCSALASVYFRAVAAMRAA